MKAKLTSGQVLQRRYTVIRLLGEGGFGAVYLVQDTRLGGKTMALKESFDNSAEAQQQFQLEANLLAALSHPNLPRVSDYFIEMSGCQYLVMDFVEGQDLTDTIINRNTPVPEVQALKWMVQVCEAVALLHGQRPRPIIHRDIKPSNIKITPVGQAVLVDFGIAKLYEAKKGTAPIAKAFSPGFSPYEQYAGGTDARSDVYALGATLYCLLTATVPPDAFHERLIQKMPLAPPRHLNPQISSTVEQVILRAMEMDPDRRYPSALELAQALQTCLGGAVVTPTPPVSKGGLVCPRCGTRNRPGARFCARDGTPLEVSSMPQITPSGGPVCPKCGAVNRPGTKFCARDGTPLVDRVPAAPAPVKPAIAPELSFEMGNAFARNGQLDEAIRSYRQSLAGGFNDQALYHNLGLAFIMADQPAQAIPVLREGLKRYSGDADIHYQLGRALALNGSTDEAVRELEQAVRLEPDDENNRLFLGMVYQDIGQHAKAIAAFEQVVRQRKDMALAHFLLGKSLLLTDQLNRAEKSLLEAIRLDPKDADYHYYLGVTRLQKKRPDQAIQSLGEAIKREPDHYLAHYFLGDAYLTRDNYREAIRWFQKATLLDPTDPDPHIQMAICWALLKQHNNAVTAVHKALAIDPNSRRARELLGKL